MNNNRNSGLILLLAGLGAGVGLTLLLAPRTGTATRKLLGRKVKSGQQWVEERADDAKDWVVTQGAGVRERVKDAAQAIVRG